MNSPFLGIKVVDLKAYADRENDTIQLLEYLLLEAKRGNLIGMAGAFMFSAHDEEGGPAIGLMHSPELDSHYYTILGALDQVKFNMIFENSTEEVEDT